MKIKIIWLLYFCDDEWWMCPCKCVANKNKQQQWKKIWSIIKKVLISNYHHPFLRVPYLKIRLNCCAIVTFVHIRSQKTIYIITFFEHLHFSSAQNLTWFASSTQSTFTLLGALATDWTKIVFNYLLIGFKYMKSFISKKKISKYFCVYTSASDFRYLLECVCIE